MAQLVSACYNVNNIRNLEIKCLGYHRTPLQLACGVQHRKVLQCIFVRPWRPSQCKGHMVCKMAGSTFFFVFGLKPPFAEKIGPFPPCWPRSPWTRIPPKHTGTLSWCLPAVVHRADSSVCTQWRKLTVPHHQSTHCPSGICCICCNGGHLMSVEVRKWSSVVSEGLNQNQGQFGLGPMRVTANWVDPSMDTIATPDHPKPRHPFPGLDLGSVKLRSGNSRGE